METRSKINASGIQGISNAFRDHLEGSSNKLSGIPDGSVNRSQTSIRSVYGSDGKHVLKVFFIIGAKATVMLTYF